MTRGDNRYESPHSIVNAFADFLKSVYVNSSRPPPDVNNRYLGDANISVNNLSITDVVKELKK